MSPPVRQMALLMSPTPGPQNQGFWLLVRSDLIR